MKRGRDGTAPEGPGAPGAAGRIVFGTCGWSDSGAPWARSGKSAAEKLPSYHVHFGCVEVDTSTYHIPSPRQVAAWVNAVPRGFVFHFKLFGHLYSGGAPQQLPRDVRGALPERLRDAQYVRAQDIPPDAQDELWRRWHRALEPAVHAGKMGVVVVQLHKNVAPGDEGARRWVARVRERIGPERRVAFEFRNRRWLSTESAGPGARCELEKTVAWLRDDLGASALVAADDLEGEMEPRKGSAGAELVDRPRLPVHLTGESSREAFLYCRVHRRQGTQRVLKPDAVQDWVRQLGRCLPRLAGPCFFLWGTDYRDQPVLNARQLRAALPRDACFDWEAWRRAHYRSGLASYFSPPAKKAKAEAEAEAEVEGGGEAQAQGGAQAAPGPAPRAADAHGARMRDLREGGALVVCSWNIGMKGLTRTVREADGGLLGLLESLGADVVCFQETKLASRHSLIEAPELCHADGWHAFFSFCTQEIGQKAIRGRSTAYAGTATFVRADAWPRGAAATAAAARLAAPLSGGEAAHDAHGSADDGADAPRRQVLEDDALLVVDEGGKAWNVDLEGRCVLTDHGAFVLVNCYAPAQCREEERPGFKLAFHQALSRRLQQLRAGGRRVLLVGDLNVIAQPLDLTTANGDRAGFEAAGYFEASKFVRWFRGLCSDQGGFVDAFRGRHPDRDGAYTCWSTKTRARETNSGSRVDHVLCSRDLAAHVADCDIDQDREGSDHCPIWVALRLPEADRPQAAPAADSLPQLAVSRWREFRGTQRRISDAFQAPGPSTEKAPPGPGSTLRSIFDAKPLAAARPSRAPQRKDSAARRTTLHTFFGRAPADGAAAAAERAAPGAGKGAGTRDTSRFEADLEEAVRRSLADCEPREAPRPTGDAGPVARERGAGGTEGGVGAFFSRARQQAAAKVPDCHHGEPARVYHVKNRKSEHYGRRFWACDHERHASGDWKSNPTATNKARCKFFKWDAQFRGYARATK